MARYIAARVFQAIAVLWAAYTVAFIFLSVLPSDPISIRINAPDSGLTEADGVRLREYYGLDKPIILQYFVRLAGIFSGDLGFSLVRGTPVRSMIAAALPPTVQLSIAGLIVGLVLGGALAVAASYARFPSLKHFLQGIPPLFAAVPTFLLGIFFIQIFAFNLNLVPAVDDGSFEGLIGPALTLGIGISPSLAQVLLASLEQTKGDAFVDVVLAKGAGSGFTFWHHVIRNAILPWLTLLGLTFGELLAGSIVIETVFSRDGLGRITEGAVAAQDLPVIQAVVLLISALYVAVNLVIDLLYPVIDPRIRLGGAPIRLKRRASLTPAKATS
ncbi:ABC transporter permease [Arthrobacter sp. H-02-3]|uniref:ABC transporter permease n=1 Tax=Arthrobacter sp. H-02-3 TaxID=2703675 RepID=UPI000DD1B671|nr:ABC transporter permease [Arthrobacter sp. H-02-3]PVZ53842.1 peptide ABC transporter permease [Arthrobacter sp. H-02-3]